MRGSTILVLGLFLAAACRGEVAPSDSRTPAIPPPTFAQVLSDLVAARVDALPDTAEYRRRRDAILREAGVTADQVRRFLDAHGRDADLMASIYHQAAVRLDTLAARGREPPAPSATPPSPDDTTP